MNPSIVNQSLSINLDNVTNLLTNISTSLNQITQTTNPLSPINPNWFYSTAAQAAATVIAIVIAFLTTWILTTSARNKQIKDELNRYKHEKESVNKEIQPFQEWIDEVDEDERTKEVNNFLNELRSEIDVNNPPKVEKLFDEAKESEEFQNIDLETLKKGYNKDFLDSARNYQNTLPIFRTPNLQPLLLNQDVIKDKWKIYREYSDAIQKQKIKIGFIEKIIKDKESELEETKNIKLVKGAFFMIIIISTVLVFFPLWMMLMPYNFMFKWAVLTYIIFLLGWIGMCYAIWRIVDKS